ncbi:MAG: lysophospholipase [Rariglobus sp.]|nr:lysophospholipase [Rariglobus sp.]
MSNTQWTWTGAVWLWMGIVFAGWLPPVKAAATGHDVVEVMARAARGEPLRYVAIGGSITQAGGPGWIGDWLRAQFPESEVTVVNSGMSATGSELGVFRIDRDVIAHQPDLVAIEYCVNDGGLTDEAAIRYMETLVVRLKTLPHPPAIVILEAAARTGSNRARHRRVARHYGLLEVDWQAAVDAHLKAEDLGWDTFFSDDVHPNEAGHAFYARILEQALQPLMDEARAKAEEGGRSIVGGDHSGVVIGAGTQKRPALPPVLSGKPLFLDARMVPLQGLKDGSGAWRSEETVPFWYGRFFQGVLSADKPGDSLKIPFRGTAVGLFFAMHEDYGAFYTSVDGGLPAHVSGNNYRGYAVHLAALDLPAREHVLTVVLPPPEDIGATVRTGGPVKLGYLLVAGESGAKREPSPTGAFDLGRLKALRFRAVPAVRWMWAGPFSVEVNGHNPLDAQDAMARRFLPEPGEAAGETGTWRMIEAEGDRVDFRALTGSQAPGVAYARTELLSERGGLVIFALEVDYFAHVWVNGQRVLTLDGPHRVPVFLPVQLNAGVNTLFVKVGAGSAGFNLRLRVGE